MLAIRNSQFSNLLGATRSANQPPRKLPIVIPASTTPITEVHVYNELPTCLAISRDAVSSNTITQTLDMNTSALQPTNTQRELRRGSPPDFGRAI